MHDLKINTGRPDWHVTRIEYLDIAAGRGTVIYQHASPEVTRPLTFTERPSRSVLSNLLIVIDTCTSPAVSQTPPPAVPPPPPPPSPPAVASPSNPCSQALLTEYDRLLGARVVLRQQRRVVEDSATRAVLDVGINNLDRTAEQAAQAIEGLGQALDQVYLQPLAGQIEAYVKAGVSASAKQKYDQGDPAGAVMDGVEASSLKDEVTRQQQRQTLQRAWVAQFRAQGTAARAMLHALAPTSADTQRRFNRQIDDIDLRLDRLRGIADESRCALPVSNLPRDSVNEDEKVLLGIHPPLDGTEPAISEEEVKLVLHPGFLFTISSKDVEAARAYRQAQQVLKPITDQDTATMLWLGGALKAVTSGDIFGGGVATLQQGTVVSTTLPGRQAKSVSLATPEARVTPQGTAYLVHRDAQRAMTFVYVTEGSVGITPTRGTALRLAAGQAALVTASGATALMPGSADAATPPTTATPSNPSFENDTNRFGSDYANFDLSQADPQLCFERCKGDNSCRAWTYVKPGVQGSSARCYLKNPAPTPTRNECCVSGAIPRIIDQQVHFEVNTNRYGSDYDGFDLPTANPDQCFERCRADNRCAAWTFVRPGVQGPLARCYLKNPAPAPTRDECCVSGAMPSAASPPPPPSPPVVLPGGDVRHDRPAVNGVAVDHCASWATDCGKGGADMFCRRQGQGDAVSFQVFNPGRTYVLGDRRTCEGGNCVGFSQVVCAGAPLPPPSPSPPPTTTGLSGSITVQGASYGRNCGAPANNVTSHAAQTCNGQVSCDYRIDHTVIGDPVYGCQKNYTIDWSCGTIQVFTLGAGPEAGFGSVVKLACPPPANAVASAGSGDIAPPPGAQGVTWYTTAKAQVDSPDGQRFSFSCPPLGPDGFHSIWGTDIYTYDSGICMAGVHTGVITKERGGDVTIGMRPGQSSYAATVRNGISSQGYGPYHKSFAIVSGASSALQAQGAAPPPTSIDVTYDDATASIAGRWGSRHGYEYDIEQSGSAFSWRVTNPAELNETGNGQFLSARRVRAGWTNRNGSGSAEGQVTRVDASGQATQIEFSNGAVFVRDPTAPPSPPPPIVYPPETSTSAGNWTGWLNRDDPQASADWEALAELRGGVPCAQPTAIECRVRGDGRDWRQTGQRYKCDLNEPNPGGICVNADNPGGCLDYEVRFLCSSSTPLPGTSTPAAPPLIYPPPDAYPPAGTTQNVCVGFHGQWNSDFGAMPIIVQDARVNGSYANGMIEGVVNGNLLEGRWTQSDRSGLLRFELSADGQNFFGTWHEANNSGGGIWNGTCVGQAIVDVNRPPVIVPPPSEPPLTAALVGCFKDTSDYDLSGYLERSPQNTPQRCVQICADKGFAYAGVQYGESCLCGNSYGKYGAANNCDYRCTGDSNQVCGGYNANSVYSTGVSDGAGTSTGKCPPGSIELMGVCSDPGPAGR